MLLADWQDFSVSKFKFKRAETSGDLLAALGMQASSDEEEVVLDNDDPFAAGVGVPVEQLHQNLRGGYRKDGAYLKLVWDFFDLKFVFLTRSFLRLSP